MSERVELNLEPKEWIMMQKALIQAGGHEEITLFKTRLVLNNQAYVIKIGGGHTLHSDGCVAGEPGDHSDFFYDYNPYQGMATYGDQLREAYEKAANLKEAGMDARVVHYGCGWEAMAEHGWEVDPNHHATRFVIKEKHVAADHVIDYTVLSEKPTLVKAKQACMEYTTPDVIVSMEVALDLDGSGDKPWYVVADWEINK